MRRSLCEFPIFRGPTPGWRRFVSRRTGPWGVFRIDSSTRTALPCAPRPANIRQPRSMPGNKWILAANFAVARLLSDSPHPDKISRGYLIPILLKTLPRSSSISKSTLVSASWATIAKKTSSRARLADHLTVHRTQDRSTTCPPGITHTALWPHPPELPSRVNANQPSVTMTVSTVGKPTLLRLTRSVGVVPLTRYTPMAPWTPTRAVGCESKPPVPKR